jgi:hypothetical protein
MKEVLHFYLFFGIIILSDAKYVVGLNALFRKCHTYEGDFCLVRPAPSTSGLVL